MQKMCPTGKKMHATQKAAQTAINQKKNAPPLYTYKCPKCRHWHLTKREQNNVEDFPLL